MYACVYMTVYLLIIDVCRRVCELVSDSVCVCVNLQHCTTTKPKKIMMMSVCSVCGLFVYMLVINIIDSVVFCVLILN